MSNPALKHLDPIVGVDLHLVQPPGPVPPIPLPHPYVGMIFDPVDYLPVLGATVWINGLPRAQAGSAGMATPPHLPLGGMFPKPPMSESEMFMGSSTVSADGDALSYNGLQVLSCQDVGMPAPVRPKGSGAKSLFLPVSTALAIPGGPPVLVGGAPTISLAGLGTAAAMKGLGGALKRAKAAKLARGISDKAHLAAKKVMDRAGVKKVSKVRDAIHNAVCTVTGHPVDVATGRMFTEAEDFRLGEAFPLSWSRTYDTSFSDADGSLGPGWHLSHEMWLREADGTWTLRGEDGRSLSFAQVPIGERLERPEDGLALTRPSEEEIYLFERHGRRHVLRKLRRNLYLRVESKDVAEPAMRYRHDAQGRLRAVEREGLRLELDWTPEGRVATVRGPHPFLPDASVALVRYAYDSRGRLVSATDPLGHALRYSYSEASALLVKETHRDGLSFHFVYAGQGPEARCLRTWGDGGIFDHHLEYGEGWTRVRDSLGHHRTYFHSGGVVTRTVDPLGHETEEIYDERRHRVAELDALGRTTRHAYDALGRLVQSEFPDGGRECFRYGRRGALEARVSPSGATTTFERDLEGRVVETVDPTGVRTQFIYEDEHLQSVRDARGETSLRWEHGEIVELRSPTGGVTQLKRDRLGRVVELVDAEGASERRRYDLGGRLIEVTEANGRRVRLAYDPEGRLVRREDDRERVEQSWWGLDQLASRMVDGEGERFEYDTEGRLIATIDRWGRRSTVERDARGDVVRATDAHGVSTELERDAAGAVCSMRRGSGRATTVARDLLGRITQIFHPGGQTSTFTYYLDGHLSSGSFGESRVTLERDRAGRVLREAQPFGFVASAHDLSGARARVSSSTGMALSFERDAAGDLCALVAGPRGQTDFETTLDRDRRGLERHRSMGGIEVSTERTFGGELSRLEVRAPGGHTVLERIVPPESYREREIDRALREGWARMVDPRFSHLGAAVLPAGMADMCLQGELTSLYREGDRADWRFGPVRGRIETRDAQNRRHVYHYDGEGRISEREGPTGRWKYAYDGAGRPSRIRRGDGRVIELEYDAFGRCIQRRDARHDTRFVWDQDRPLHELRTERGGSAHSEQTFADPLSFDEDEPTAETALDGVRAAGGAVKTWLFDPDTGELLGKLEHTEAGAYIEDGTRYAVNDAVDMPAALLDATGSVRWRDDGWRERRGCFAAGTPVWTPTGPVPIEDVQLGDVVLTHPRLVSANEDAYPDEDGASGRMRRLTAAAAALLALGGAGADGRAQAAVEPWHATTLELAAPDDPEHRYSIELLRPGAAGALEVGDTLPLEVSELHISGDARVLGVRAAEPPSEHPLGRPVTMCLSHEAGRGQSVEIFELKLEDEPTPLGVTGGHPLYSLDRDDWVRVRDLQVGERLQTAEGAVAVEALDRTREVLRVYNLEVGDDHEYSVGRKQLRSHNARLCGREAKGLIGEDFEKYLTSRLGGAGSFSVGGREFDGGITGRWWEAKSGQYWDLTMSNPWQLGKFKADMGARLRIAGDHGASYELFSNTPIPMEVKMWLSKKGIEYTELLDE